MKKFRKRFDIEIEKQSEINLNLTERLETLSVKLDSIDKSFSQKLLTFDKQIRRLEDFIPQTNSVVRLFFFYQGIFYIPRSSELPKPLLGLYI